MFHPYLGSHQAVYCCRRRYLLTRDFELFKYIANKITIINAMAQVMTILTIPIMVLPDKQLDFFL